MLHIVYVLSVKIEPLNLWVLQTSSSVDYIVVYLQHSYSHLAGLGLIRWVN